MKVSNTCCSGFQHVISYHSFPVYVACALLLITFYITYAYYVRFVRVHVFPLVFNVHKKCTLVVLSVPFCFVLLPTAFKILVTSAGSGVYQQHVYQNHFKIIRLAQWL